MAYLYQSSFAVRDATVLRSHLYREETEVLRWRKDLVTPQTLTMHTISSGETHPAQ